MFGKCQNCSQNNWVVDESKGDAICFVCGMTFDVSISDSAAEKINYDMGKTNYERNQKSSHVFSSAVSTHLKSRDKSSAVVKTHKYLNKLENLQDAHLQGYKEEINSYCECIELSSAVRNKAFDILVEYEKSQNTKKRTDSFKCGALAAIYLACKVVRNGKTLNQILLYVEDVDVQEKDVIETHDKIVTLIPYLRSVNLNMHDVICEQCRLLGVNKKVSDAACKIYTKCESFIDGASIATISAGCITIACRLLKMNVSKEDIAVTAVVTTTTIDNFCRNINSSYHVTLIDII